MAMTLDMQSEVAGSTPGRFGTTLHGQVVHAHVRLIRRSIILYWPKGGGARCGCRESNRGSLSLSLSLSLWPKERRNST